MDELKLNPQQLKVVSKVQGAILVVSGPGTGKTTTIKHYIINLLKKGYVSPEKILAVTFTNRAAEEMKERISTYVDKLPYFATIHSFAASVLRKFPPPNYTSDFSIADEALQFRLIKRIAKNLTIDEHPRYLLEKMTLARNTRDKNILKTDNLELLYKIYMQEMRKENYIDYDGLLTWCNYILNKSAKALKYYQDRYKYVIVDEFQDISPIQYDILYKIVAKKGNFLAVGDFDQSIYKFRGADVNIMLNLEKDFPNLQTLYLEENYRSTPNIIKNANNLINNNKQRKKKDLWTKRKKGEDPFIYSAKNEYEEGEKIAKIILSQIKKGKKFSDFAILYRVHYLSKTFEEIFTSLQIPYNIIGGVGFFSRLEIKNIIAFLKLVKNPRDWEAFDRAIKMLYLSLGSRINFNLQEALFNGLTPMEYTQYAKEEFIRYFPNFILELSQKASLYDIYNRILEYTHYVDFLKKDKSSFGKKQLENVEEMASVLLNFDKNNKNINDLLAFVENTQKDIKDVDSVKLMTVHSAKGLEFDTVFLVGAEKSMFPHFNNENIEEERRLFYVALTRAKNNLYISYPLERIIKGKKSRRNPSEFINELNLKSNFTKGDIVEHSHFGEGYISAIKYYPDKTILKINFKNVGFKDLLLEYANLRKK